MPAIDNKYLLQIQKLYQQGYSVKKIGEKFGYSIHATFYFFRKHNIKRRTNKELGQIFSDNTKPTYQAKNNLTQKEKDLRMAGLMLYWAEGSKWQGETKIDFANSNPEMIKIFLKFLREIYVIQEKKLRVYLYCYENQAPGKLVNFWSGLTKIPKEQFTKPYVRLDYKENKKDRMKYGLVHIRYHDKKLFLHVMDSIQKNINNLTEGTKVVKWA